MASFGNAASSHSGLIPLKTSYKKEVNCSGQSQERRILLPPFSCFCYSLYAAISNNVVRSKHKAGRQDRKVMWDFFLFIKTSYASPAPWRFTMASLLNVRSFRISSRWGSSCFEDGKSGVSSTLSWVPFSTRNCISELYSVPVLTD